MMTATDDAPQSATANMLKAALWYARHGWPVIPLHEPLFDSDGRCVGCTCEGRRRQNGDPTYTCPTPGKHPRIKVWESSATTDPAQIAKWWHRWLNANIGIAAGRAGLVVVDKDTYHMAAEGGTFALADTETVTNLTGGGGEHLIYRHPQNGPRISNADSSLPKGVNIRAYGGLFVAPPSLHKSGNRYEWEQGYGPHEIEPSELPAALRALLQPAEEEQRRAAPISERIAAGGRNSTLTSLGGSLRRRGIPHGSIEAALLAVNAAQCEPPLPVEEVQAIAKSVSKYSPPMSSGNGNGATVAPDATKSNAPDITHLEVSSKPMTVRDLLACTFKPQIPLVDGLLAKGNLVLLAARAKAGKTILMLCMTMSIDAGVPFLGRDTTRARVLYYALEDGARRVQQRLLSFNWQPSERAAFLFSIANLDDGQGGPGPGVAEIWGHTKDYDLIVVDTLTAAMSGRTDERDNSSMGAILNALAQVAHDSDTAILIVHHTGKAVNPDDTFATLRGASAIRGAYDLGLVLERKPGEREAVLHVESRDMDVRPMTLRQAENGAGWEYLGDSNELERVRAGRKVFETMLEHDARGDGMTAKQLADIRKVSEAAIHKQLTRLEKDGYVCREEEPSTQMGKRPDIWRVAEGYRYTQNG